MFTEEALLKRFFFFDIDGTVAHSLTAIVPESTREALAELQRQGNFVALATGRLQADAWKMAEKLDLTALVSDGGSCLTIDGQILYHDGLSLPLVAEMLDDLDVEKHPWAAVPKNEMVRYSRDGRYEDMVEERYYKTIIDPQFDYHKADCLYKLYIACERSEEKTIPFHGLPHVWFWGNSLLIEPTAKERGIEKVLRRYGAEDSQVVVFGDGTNDVSMFRPEWMSVAMGNAKPVLKERAKYVTDTVDNDGIWKACKKFGWI